MTDYDQAYSQSEHYFGSQPTPVLERFYHLIEPAKPVLDIGAGQGRNALFLARKGFTVQVIEPSPVACGIIQKIAEKENLPLQVLQCGFESFNPPLNHAFAAMLLFGIIPEQSRKDIEILSDKIKRWPGENTLIFMTAFTVKDDKFKLYKAKGKELAKNCFLCPDGICRTYLESGELKTLFKSYKIVYYEEIIGPPHRHGDSPVERHSIVEAVFQWF